MGATDHCAACGAEALSPHITVAEATLAEGMAPTTDRFGSALGDIVRCRQCGHMQLDRLPDAAELADAYAAVDSGDYIDEETGQRLTAARTLDRIERHVEVGSLLDLGCWVGFLLLEAEGRGWTAVGVEPSEHAVRYARDRLGLDVRVGDILEAELEPRSFNAVVMGDVIEHLPDPGMALDRVAALIAPGGVLALALPDAGSLVARSLRRRWWSVIPTHVQYFTRGSMRTLLARHGYRQLEVTTAPKTFTARYYLERLGGYRRSLGATLGRAARALRIADRPWTPDFRDRMLVVARPGPTPSRPAAP